MTKLEHIHRFKRVKFKTGSAIFFCVQPDCNKRINPVLTLGKKSLCWRCNQPFILDEYSIRLAKPHCNDCHKPREKENAKPELIGVTETLTEKLQRELKEMQTVGIEEEEL